MIYGTKILPLDKFFKPTINLYLKDKSEIQISRQFFPNTGKANK